MNTMIRILAYNRPGVLDRIAGIVRRRGWNIDGLTVGNIEAGGRTAGDAASGNAAGDLVQINLSVTGQHIDAAEFGDRLSELHDVESWEQCRPPNHIIREILLFRYLRDSEQSMVISRLSGVKIIEEDRGLIYAECTGSPEETADRYALLQKNSISCVSIGKMILAKEGGNSEDGKRDV